MKTVKLRLTIEVEYDPGTTATQTLKGRLFDIADTAAGDGLMTVGTSAEVVSWNSNVDEIEEK